MKTACGIVWVFLAAGIVLCAAATAQQPAPNPVPPPGVIEAAPGAGPVRFVPFGYGAGAHGQPEQLARQLAKAEKEEQKKDLRKKLTDVLAKQFDQHMERQQKELADLERQIAELRSVLKKRGESRDTIIEQRIEQLVREAQGLGWSTPGGPGRPTAGYYGAAYPQPPGSFLPVAPGTRPPAPK